MLSLCLILSCNTIMTGSEGIECNTSQALRLWIPLIYSYCGYGIYELRNQMRNGVNKIKQFQLIIAIVIFWIASSFLQFSLLNRVIGIHSPEYLFSNPIVIMINNILFLGILLITISDKFQNGIQYLSQISFGVYILHMFVITGIDRFLPGMSWYLKWIIVTILSFGASSILHRIPFLKKLVIL